MQIRIAPEEYRVVKKKQWTRFGIIVGCAMVAGYLLFPLVNSTTTNTPSWVFFVTICGLYPFPLLGILTGLIFDGIGAEIRRERQLNGRCWSCSYQLDGLAGLDAKAGDLLTCPECNKQSQIVEVEQDELLQSDD
ncbi:MAG: hypothetical protein KDA31_10335 [Phycisphaerales bacterium]|nr:hypothetical protein [Phycisphaerales bacterium]MCB9837497.1 hypothetical protein [Phycisphaera sp.]